MHRELKEFFKKSMHFRTTDKRLFSEGTMSKIRKVQPIYSVYNLLNKVCTCKTHMYSYNMDWDSLRCGL